MKKSPCPTTDVVKDLITDNIRISVDDICLTIDPSAVNMLKNRSLEVKVTVTNGALEILSNPVSKSKKYRNRLMNRGKKSKRILTTEEWSNIIDEL